MSAETKGRRTIAVMFGGREAEIMAFGPENVTNGATGVSIIAARPVAAAAIRPASSP